jgi:hypothetical protein
VAKNRKEQDHTGGTPVQIQPEDAQMFEEMQSQNLKESLEFDGVIFMAWGLHIRR